MKTLVDHLSQYGAYHRDARNVATHMVGIPIIVLAVEILASRPMFNLGFVTATPAMLLSVVAVIFYLTLDVGFGLTMAVLLALGAWAGLWVAGLSTLIWLGTGVVAFAVGWIIQFIGHGYEGRKPAFLDDLVGLIVGPLFIVAEIAFLLGFRKNLAQTIEANLKMAN